MGMRRRRAREQVPSARVKNAYRNAWTLRRKGGKSRQKKPNAPSLKAFARSEAGGAPGQDWLKNKKK